MSAQILNERFEMRLSKFELEQIDVWRAGQGGVPSRAEAIRRLIEAGLAATADTKVDVTLSAGDKLILLMLRDMYHQLDLKDSDEINPDFIAEAISGGHTWGLEWRHPDVFHGHEDRPAALSEVVNILEMWFILEVSYNALSKKDKDRVVTELRLSAKTVRFKGFDGNTEGEHLEIARFMIDHLHRFPEFAGRDLDAHIGTLDMHHRMLAVFTPMRRHLAGSLTAAEIINILKEQVHPSNRKKEKETLQ